MSDVATIVSSARCFVCFSGVDEAAAMELELLVQISGAMNATDPQSLLSSAQCYICQGVSTAQALKLSLLAKISLAHNPLNKVDPQSLLSQAKCFACFSNASIGRLMELALLAQIAT